MSRDLLYKPAVPILNPEESEAKEKPGVKKTPRARELGNVGEAAQPTQTRAPEQPGKTQAYKAAYFNKDISGVNEANLRQSNMKALRGGEGATDLKKIVLPPGGKDSPDPAQLRGATDLMGLDGSFELNLETLLGRQGAFVRGKGVTAEMIQQRMKQLERLVEDRKRALARMAKGKAKKRASSATVEQAERTGGQALSQVEDVVTEGGALVGRTHGQAEGMHKRIAKMLGIKR